MITMVRHILILFLFLFPTIIVANNKDTTIVSTDIMTGIKKEIHVIKRGYARGYGGHSPRITKQTG